MDGGWPPIKFLPRQIERSTRERVVPTILFNLPLVQGSDLLIQLRSTDIVTRTG